jgi:UDP-N-acetylmuramyl pentapeptide synthase
VADVPSAKSALAAFLRVGDAVLLKASHGMHLEAVLA